MIVINALFPVLALLLVGVALKRWQLTDANFLRTSDRLIYYVFFPVMLFAKIGGAPLHLGDSWRFLLASALAVGVIFLLSLLCIVRKPISSFQAGSFSQGCYRFNTYIGMAVVLNTLGETGAQLYGVLVGLLIPLINVMAVSVLIWYGKGTHSWWQRGLITIKQLLANPLILGCLAGILYAQMVGHFPLFLDNTLKLLSQVTLPMALFSIGGILTLQALRNHGVLALLACCFKLLLLPLAGLVLLKLFQVTGLPWKVSMIFFSLPTSTASYILSSQLHSDLELASATIVLSTLLSFASMSVILLLVG